VAVRFNRELVHLNCYGYANLETGAKITLDTIFDLGSLSKQFTAMSVLDLEIAKQLDLNDPLSKFFKEFPRYADSITVEDLIHHTSGLPDYTKLHVASRRAAEDWYEKALAKPNDWYPKMLKKLQPCGGPLCPRCNLAHQIARQWWVDLKKTIS
jgi:CubicO group peptidase (beta-lactamase class C family)